MLYNFNDLFLFKFTKREICYSERNLPIDSLVEMFGSTSGVSSCSSDYRFPHLDVGQARLKIIRDLSSDEC